MELDEAAYATLHSNRVAPDSAEKKLRSEGKAEKQREKGRVPCLKACEVGVLIHTRTSRWPTNHAKQQPTPQAQV